MVILVQVEFTTTTRMETVFIGIQMKQLVKVGETILSHLQQILEKRQM